MDSAPYQAGRNISNVVRNRSPLQPNAFYLLPLTSIKPNGWLRRQLRIQADGISGHLDEFWPDVGPKSGWLGGDGESWERGPYFLDGLVPLAYLLDDPRLIDKVRKWVEWTLTHTSDTGWIGPKKNTDWWPNMVMLKVLTQYQEASGDSRVIPVIQRYFMHHYDQINQKPLQQWAIFRWYEELQSVLWLYNRTGAPELLELARGLKKQGFNWNAHFEEFKFKAKTSQNQLGLKPGVLPSVAMSVHGVNNAMALKSFGFWWLLSGDPSDRNGIYQALKQLDTYHGLPNGMFSADEHYAGTDPSQGVELCTVVESMFSLENSIAILGDPVLADRLEKITFNALPATFSADMWSHQYDQQPNQILCSLQSRHWTSNGPESNLFGLEPNFGCCTANMHQGWPKFTASLWMATPDDGLAAISYAPCDVRTTVRDGVQVNIIEETSYPFRSEVRLTVNPSVPATFPIRLRVPAWAAESSIHVNGDSVPDILPGTFSSVERQWKMGDQILLRFPLHPRATRSYHNSVVIEQGPLVFSLRLEEDWKKITRGMSKPAISPAADWEVKTNSPWNFGLKLDTTALDQSIQVVENPIGDYPFSAQGSPLELKMRGRRIPQWQLTDGSAGLLPESPVSSREPEEELILIPYGAAKLRITAFPQLSSSK